MWMKRMLTQDDQSPVTAKTERLKSREQSTWENQPDRIGSFLDGVR
jgi:hypothetical protein